MKRCRNCNAAVSDESYFCDACGEPLFDDGYSEPEPKSQARDEGYPAVTRRIEGEELDKALQERPGSQQDIPQAGIVFPEIDEEMPRKANAWETATGVYFVDRTSSDIEVTGEKALPSDPRSPARESSPEAASEGTSAGPPHTPLERGSDLRRAYMEAKEELIKPAEQPPAETKGIHVKKRPVHSQRAHPKQHPATQQPPPAQPQTQQSPVRPTPTQPQGQQGPIQPPTVQPHMQQEPTPPTQRPPTYPAASRQSTAQPQHGPQPLKPGQYVSQTTGMATAGAYPRGPQQAAMQPGYPSRDELRRMVVEQRARRKKLLMIGVPALAVIVVAIVALSFLFLFGKGMSPQEYREQVSPQHNRIVAGLGTIDSDWTYAETSDTPYSECFQILTESTQEIQEELAVVKPEVTAIEPPQEMDSLHQELLTFYEDLEAYLVRADIVFRFMIDWTTILEEISDYTPAVNQVESNPNFTTSELIAWMDQDIAAFSAYVQRLSALSAPEECMNLHNGHIAALQEEISIIERMKRAIINRDEVAFDVAAQDLDVLYNDLDNRYHNFWQDIANFRNQFWDLADQGDALKLELNNQKGPRPDESIT